MLAEEAVELQHIIVAASNSAGPCGRARALRTSESAGARTFLTSSAAACLQHWPVQKNHHVVRLVVDTAEAHLRRHVDGGWLFINFCLRVSLSLLGVLPGHGEVETANMPRTAALRGLALASSWIEEALRDDCCPCRLQLRFSDLSSVLTLLRSALCKPIALPSPEDVKHLSVAILESFLEGLSAGVEDANELEAGLRYSWFCGPDVCWSSMIRGVLLDTPAAFSIPAPPNGEDLTIVLFEASLEQWLPFTPEEHSVVGGERFSITSVLDGREGKEEDLVMVGSDALRRWELQKFEGLATALVNCGIRILACQKLVDPWLADNLRHRGVTVLSRLSLRHMQHVRRLSGAFPVLSLATLPKSWKDVSGMIGGVETRRICERNYTLLLPPSHPKAAATGAAQKMSAIAAAPVATLLVGAPDEHALAELKRCVPQAVQAIREVARSQSADGSGTGVLVGGGLVEVHLANTLRKRAKLELASDTAARRAVFIVAECLSDVAACLAPIEQRSHGIGPPAAIRENFLDAAHEALNALVEEQICPAGAVLDMEASKKFALLGALDLAGVLLRLGVGRGALDFINHPIG